MSSEQHVAEEVPSRGTWPTTTASLRLKVNIYSLLGAYLLAVGSHRHTRLTTSAYSILMWTTFCGMGLDY